MNTDAVNSSKTQGNRKIHIDIMRILATFFVIMLHVAAQNWNGDIHTREWLASNLYDGISRWGVPVFTMISGALFLDRELSLKQIYAKYIFRILIALLFWSFVYSFVIHISGKLGIKSFIAGWIRGYHHLWFLYMIVGLYMIIPFLKMIANDKQKSEYFLLLSLLFAFLLPQIHSVSGVFSPRLSSLLGSLIDKLHFHFVLGFSSYFVLGFYMEKYSISRRMERTLVVLGMIGFITTVFMTKMISGYAQNTNDAFYGELTVNVLAEAVVIFAVCKNRLSKIRLTQKAERAIIKLSKYSFGAYLTHIMVITLLDKLFHLNTASFNPFFSMPVISVLVFIISFAFSALINHIPILNKYIV